MLLNFPLNKVQNRRYDNIKRNQKLALSEQKIGRKY